MDFGFEYAEKNKLETEADYPYSATDATCHADPSKGKVEIKSYSDVDANKPKQLMAAVAQGPVSVAIEADTSVF